MTEEQRAAERVAIAKDVLQQLGSNQLIAGHGGYVVFWRNPQNWDFYENHEKDPAQPIIDEIKKHCHVCARGALIISYVARHNKLSVRELSRQACRPNSVLGEFFDNDQLGLIEAAYELDEDFYDQYPNPQQRLIAIMENLVKNNGTFVP